MRDCLFYVADKNQEAIFRGFLERQGAFSSLNCHDFQFNWKSDLKVATGQADPGLFTRAQHLVQPYASTHRHIVLVMDAEWDGAPQPPVIRERLREHLELAGWTEDKHCAIVIEPELEAWVWQDSPHVCSALGFQGGFPLLRQELESQGFWRSGDSKPHRPKDAMEWILKRNRIPRSSALYRLLAGRVGIAKCQDTELGRLKSALQRWFPR